MIQKKAGRPRTFDEGEALDAAILVFWAKGYDGASMKDLTEAMGINSPSLYGAFGDKRNLFLQTIARYGERGGCPPLVAFDAEADIAKAVSAFFKAAIDHASAGAGPKGCYLSSSVITSAEEVEGVKAMLSSAIEKTETRLVDRFEMERAKGALPPGFPSAARARLMFDLRQGLVYRARAGLDADAMRANLTDHAEMVIA